MQSLFDRGDIIVAILIAMSIEGLVLLVVFRGNPPKLVGLLANLVAGACLLMAVRSALIGSDPALVALWIGLALPAHLTDVAIRVFPQLSRTGHKPSRSWRRRLSG